MKISEERLAEIKENFDFFDDDANKKLDFNEFRHVVNAVGGGIHEDELKIGFEIIDKDNSGFIDFNEFVSWWENR